MIDDISCVLSELSSIQPDPPVIRSVCEKCRRPTVSCWCCFLPEQPLSVSTKVYILQHPFEESRNLQTGQMLVHGLETGHCQIFKGKKFSLKRFPELEQILEDPNTILLFPGPKAVDMTEFVECQRKTGQSLGPYNLVVLDGTWHQARGIYWQNQLLHSLKQVQLNNTGLSKYVIRTQPTDSGLSTVETVALAICSLEDRDDVYEILTRPLDALCEDQLKHGAVRHHSKQYLVENGLYVKQKTHLIGLKRKLAKQQLQKPNASSVTNECSSAHENMDRVSETAEMEDRVSETDEIEDRVSETAEIEDSVRETAKTEDRVSETAKTGNCDRLDVTKRTDNENGKSTD